MRQQDISRNILPLNSTIEEAMQRLNTGIGGVLLCVDQNGAVRGLLTDGDIRRALLRGATLDTTIDSHMNRLFKYGTTSMTHAEHIKMLSATVRHVPILEAGKPVGMVSWGQFWRLPVTEPSLGGNEMKYLADCINTVWISSQGDYIERFQHAFEVFHGDGVALCTSSGTAALHLALKALNIGSGDEVIIPDTTFGASANAVIHVGATPIFVDIDPITFTIDVSKIEASISARTKAIMPVHLYGHPCNMDPLMEIARKYQLKVVEDCAEALGAEYKGHKVGLIGDVGCFSFFANKIITTGEGGMVFCRDPLLMERMALLRDHGMSKQRRYWHLEAGFNFRMTNMQAALGLAQMERIDNFLKQRDSLVSRYNERLSPLNGINLPHTAPWARNIHWLYTITVDSQVAGFDRDYLATALLEAGIETRQVFPPLHVQPAYGSAPFGGYPVSEKLAREGMSLPTSNGLDLESVDLICDAIEEVFQGSKAKCA